MNFIMVMRHSLAKIQLKFLKKSQRDTSGSVPNANQTIRTSLINCFRMSPRKEFLWSKFSTIHGSAGSKNSMTQAPMKSAKLQGKGPLSVKLEALVIPSLRKSSSIRILKLWEISKPSLIRKGNPSVAMTMYIQCVTLSWKKSRTMMRIRVVRV